MNVTFIHTILTAYKNSFEDIHTEEIYKWAAVANFQATWDIDSREFAQMLDLALSKTANLLSSGSYYPRRMIVKFSHRNPDTVRELFKDLYNENYDLVKRIRDFQAGANSLLLSEEDLNTYQDHRAIIVYLCLRYPDRYFLYKFDMFKEFVRMVGLPYQPRAGAIENILQFYNVCEQLRTSVLQDNELLLMHQRRLKQNHYADPSFTLLTQDIIYAAVRHLHIQLQGNDIPVDIQEVSIELYPEQFEPSLRGVFINYLDNERESRHIGSIGEQMIMEYETRLLQQAGIFHRTPIHEALRQGDGIGYDIKSYTFDDQEKFIEVKATRGPFNSNFYITQNELIKSRQVAENYYLYRLYDINEREGKGKLIIRRGSLDLLCLNPSVYSVVLRPQRH